MVHIIYTYATFANLEGKCVYELVSRLKKFNKFISTQSLLYVFLLSKQIKNIEATYTYTHIHILSRVWVWMLVTLHKQYLFVCFQPLAYIDVGCN